MIINSNHPFLSLTTNIAEISKPLRRLGITYFSYGTTHSDGSRTWLCTTPTVVENYYAKNYHLSGNTESHPSRYKPQTLLWSTLPKQYIYKDSHDLGVAHGMFMIEPIDENTCDFFSFATTQDNPGIINTYLTHLDFLKRFNEYFKEKAAPLIKQAHANKIYSTFHSDHLDFIAADYDTKLDTLITLKNASTEIHLSPRQLECARYLVAGKTYKNISKITGLSTRTIEYYINLLKEKLNCKNKVELALKLNEFLQR